MIHKGIAAFFVMLPLLAPATAQTVIPFSSGPVAASLIFPAFNDASANWKNAGMLSVGGIPSRSTQCGSTLNPIGVIATTTGSRSGTTLTVSSGTGIAVNQTVYDNSGVITSAHAFGVITGGSGTSWTVNASGTLGSQTLKFYAQDLTQLNSAITACPLGQVVLLGSGTFQIPSTLAPIILNKGVSLRGTGICNNGSQPYCSTRIILSDGAVAFGSTCVGANICQNSSSPVIHMGNYDSATVFTPWWDGCQWSVAPGNCNGTAATLTADAAQGDTTIHVSNTTNFSSGQWVLIDEASNGAYQTDPAVGSSQVWAESDFATIPSGTAIARVVWQKHNPGLGSDDFGTAGGDVPTSITGSGGNSCYPSWGFCDRPTAELHKIASVGTNTLTFDSPLTIAFRQSGSHNAQVYYLTDNSGTLLPFVTNAGVENMTVEQSAGGGVLVQACGNCWVEKVECYHFITGCININYSSRVQIDMIYAHECTFPFNTGAEYPIDLKFAATEVYIVNSITRLCGKGMTARSAGAGSVVAYNWLDQTYYGAVPATGGLTDVFQENTINGSHSVGSHMMLFEGNQGTSVGDDSTHGSIFYHTYFRNWAEGLRFGSFVDPTNSTTINDATNSPAGIYPLAVVVPMAYNYWHAFVGNVLGTSGQTTSGNGWTYRKDYVGVTKSIFMAGWAGSLNDTNLNSGAASPFYFKNGNYDYVNGSVSDCAAGYSCTLPNSLYLSSTPAFFNAGATATYPWPWVTPAGASQIQTNSLSGSGLPAKARVDAGTPFVQP